MTECAQIELLLSARLDGALTEAEAADVEAHIAACPACRALADDLATLSAAMRELEVPAPDLLIPQVLRRIRPSRHTAHWHRFAAMAAVFTLIVSGGIGVRQWLSARQELPPPAISAVLGGTGADTAEPAPRPIAEPVETGEATHPVGVTRDEAPGDQRLALPEGENGDGSAATDSIAPSAPGDVADPPASVGAFGTEAKTPEVASAEPPAAVFTAPAAAADGILRHGGASDMPTQTAGSADGTDAGTVALPESVEDIAPLSENMVTQGLLLHTASLTPAEAEAVLRLYLNDASAVLTYIGTLPGGHHRFDWVEAERVFAVSADGQQIVEQGTPEDIMIADWDPQPAEQEPAAKD